MKIKIIIVAGLFLLLSLLAGAIFYSPPLLQGRGFNPPGRAYDFLAYVWHITAATWRASPKDPLPALRSAARAAWHRPSRLRDLIGIDRNDLRALAEEYDSLGLKKEAVGLLRKAAAALPGEERRAGEIISYLAALGDWGGTAAAARRQLSGRPGSAAVEYWLGRALLETGSPQAAVKHLQRSLLMNPELADVLFRLGNIAEKRGEGRTAAGLYERALAAAPAHLEARAGLVRLCLSRGEEEEAEEIGARAEELVPESARDAKLGNFAVFAGYDPPADLIFAGGEMELALFLEGWLPEATEVGLALRIRSDASEEELTLPLGTAVLNGPGEVTRLKIKRDLPPILYPGEISLDVVFRKGKTARSEPLGSFRLLPAWMESAGIDPPLAEKFGRGAASLGKAAFLGPGDELELSLDPPLPAAALVLVSYLHCGMHLLQGAEAGAVAVRTEAGDEFSYPLRAGREVSEVWWESVAPGRRNHERAPVFRSWPAESGGKKFSAGEYSAVFPFARPLLVEGLRLRNSTGRSGWHVTGIALLPPEEEVPGASRP